MKVYYLNKEDYIIFVSTVLCFVWIIFYKFLFVMKQSLFEGADKIGDIIYIISTSILASRAFYFLNIYLPRYFNIKRNRTHVIENITWFNLHFNNMLSEISEEYSHFSILDFDFHKNHIEKFKTNISSEELIEHFEFNVSCLFSFINKIVNFKPNVLTDGIMNNVPTFRKLDSHTLSINKRCTLYYLDTMYYVQFMNNLKSYYKIKDNEILKG